ncbi:MAG: HNH endonuclease [Bacteroidota bacterium]
MATETCPICQRELGDINTSRHHLIPKSRGGTFEDTILIHNICHQKIHSVFTNRELETTYNTAESIREHEQMQKFIKWVRKRDPGFYEKNHKMRKR